MENHSIILENREKITVSNVTDVDAFDENVLWANLQEGAIEITGEKLNIERLDLKDGLLVATGTIWSVSYTDRQMKKKKKFHGNKNAVR